MDELKYKGIDPKIAEELAVYENKYFREDLPVPFCGLSIYPATVHDYEIFSNCSGCFTLNKNSEVAGIKMSHLDYLLSKTQLPEPEGSDWSFKIQKLFEIIFHINNGLKCDKCGEILTYSDPTFLNYVKNMQIFQGKIAQLKKMVEEGIPDTNIPQDLLQMTPEDVPVLQCSNCGEKEFSEMIKVVQDSKTKKYSLIIDGHTISKEDFNRLRQIVLFQNFPDYRDDSWVDPDIKKDYEAKMELQQKKNDVYASIETKVVCLSISTHYSFKEIYDMSIRKFTMALTAVDDLINYKIMRTATMSGFVSLPKGQKIDHWIYKPNRDMYGDSYKSADEAQSEVKNL